jgi:ABC-type nitrate/sulfonate/bicarbonate transport system substrate-binding protein
MKHAILKALLLLVLAACSRATSSEHKSGAAGEPETLTLRHQGSTGQVWFPELADDLGYLTPLKLEYVGNTISGPQDIQTVATGDVEFGLAFNGAIIKLVAAHAPIRAVIGGYGVDSETFTSFFVRGDSPIKSARDLIGKQVAMNTLGAHSEFMLREYLRRNGLSDDEVKKVTMIVLPPVNIEQALRGGQIELAALTSLFRDKALERGGVRQLFSDYDLFGQFTAGSYVFTRKFIEKNPNTVRKFVDGVAKAIEWTRTTPREQVIARYAAIIAKRHRNENADAVKYWKSPGIGGRGGLIADRELQIWIDWLVRDRELTRDQLKPSDIYTNQFNPFLTQPRAARDLAQAPSQLASH